ncbi:type II/III secretion system family protein [Paraburkholderia sp.]|uniref:type II/III secretion system family protein n=1 Tax=Paraburkholderia sp. TaxID=1926495 RepID=UPI003D6F66F0
MSIRIPTIHRTLCAGVLALALVCSGLGMANVANAAGVVWQGTRFVYQTSGSSVAETLRLFAEGQNVPLRVSGDVTGTVRGRFSMPPQQFLEMLCASYDLVWYDDGTTIEVLPASDQQILEMRPNYMTPSALVVALDHAGASDPYFPLQVDMANGTVGVRGPADYIERVRNAAQRFELDARDHTRTAVKVLRLKSSIAADQVRSIDGRDMVVRGVATRLAARFRHGRLDATAIPAVAPVEFDAPLPIVEADAATNSILVRDKPERIDGDAMLVADFDVQPQLVSVQTWVVDVDRDALAELGDVLPLHAAAPDGAASSTPAASTTLDFATAADGGHDLLERLHALVQAKRAYTEVSRTALTVDRSPAVIDRHEARLAVRDGDVPDSSMDLWLSVQPTLDAAAAYQRIGLRVDLGRAPPVVAGKPGAERIVAANLAPGDCLVIAAPPPDDADPHAPQRLVLLIPRIAA